MFITFKKNLSKLLKRDDFPIIEKSSYFIEIDLTVNFISPVVMSLYHKDTSFPFTLIAFLFYMLHLTHSRLVQYQHTVYKNSSGGR